MITPYKCFQRNCLLVNHYLERTSVLIEINLISIIGDDVDYEEIIKDKFPNCNVEVLTPDIFELENLAEYITDDILVYNPHIIFVYRHLIRFMVNVDCKGKIYYLDGFSEEDLKVIYAGLLKYAWEYDVKVNLFKNSDPDNDLLGL